MGAGGALALGGGLLLAGVTPTAGFWLNATAWCAHAVCHVALAPSTAVRSELRSALGSVVVRSGAPGRRGVASLNVRVAGWHRRMYQPFDTVVACLAFCALLCVKPAWTYAAFVLIAKQLGQMAALARSSVVLLARAYV